MVKTLAFIVTFVAVALLCAGGLSPREARAREDRPTRVERLLIEDDLMALWALGHMESRRRNDEDLCRDALYFTILTSPELVVSYEEDSTPFQGVEDYQSFVPKEVVEKNAASIFGQKITKHVGAEPGYKFNGKGYLIDIKGLLLQEGSPYSLPEDDTLPGFAQILEAGTLEDGSLSLSGRLRRFKDTDNGEILWRSAAFVVVLRRAENGWQVVNFNFTEEAMG